MAGFSFPGRSLKRWTLAFLLLVLLLPGCSSEVAKVGDLSISEEDLSRQARVSELYFPGSGQRYVALSQLIKGYLALAETVKEYSAEAGENLSDLLAECKAEHLAEMAAATKAAKDKS